jgi:cell filamentation protein, protein adenylyltransferase
MRTYEQTHPWINFKADLSKVTPPTWILLGEARSKCDHLSSIPLHPEMAEVLHMIYLAKGAGATTAIEGNTLSEDQVLRRVAGTLDLPSSQEYLGREVDNIVLATNQIWDEVSGRGFADAQLLTVDELCRFNQIVLEETEFADYVTPGHIRESLPVGVGGYRGAPPEDCRYLLERFCSWLNEWRICEGEDSGVIPAIIKAIVAHVTFEWIHPFADGNGRVGRLLEFKILVAGGVPTVAAHLLSNHYNLTRNRYYVELQRASTHEDGIVGFLSYAIEGFVDQLVQQIDLVLSQQLKVLWDDLIYRRLSSSKSVTNKRQRDLALAISTAHEPLPLKDLPALTRDLTIRYANLTDRTLIRDLTELKKLGLVTQTEAGYRANMGLLMSHFSRRRLEVESRYLRSREETTLDKMLERSKKVKAEAVTNPEDAQ